MTGTTGRTPPVRNAQCAISIGAFVQSQISTDTDIELGYTAGVATWLRKNKRLNRAYVSEAFGLGLAARVRAGYRFLSTKDEPGDTVYLFGFSRGAYTTRSLASFVDFCGGVLPRERLPPSRGAALPGCTSSTGCAELSAVVS